MQMKKILESLQECGMPMSNAPVEQGNPVTMSITLNASGKDHVADLIAMMKNAGLQNAQPVAPSMMPMDMDIRKFRDIVDEPMIPGEGADNTPKEEYMDAEELMAGGDDLHHEKHPADIRLKDPSAAGDISEWDNEPDEEYADHNTMLKDLSGGINREKKMFKKAQDGDNPMAVETIKQRLVKALAEKKAKPDFLDMDKDGNKKEPMKKAVADKKKGAVKEERVDELSPKTLGSYATKVAKLEPHEVKPSREKGIEKATKKIQSKKKDGVEEASGKFDPLKHVKNPTKGEKDAAKDVKRGSYADRAAMLKSAEKDGRLKK